jgi:hypothetical protein
MTKKSNWFVTRKPNESEYALYDFARTATQAKNMLRDLGEGNPIAHKSKSEGGLYNIYVKKGTVLWREKGGSTYQGGGEVAKSYLHLYKLTYPNGEYTVEAYDGDYMTPKEALEKMRISLRGLKSYKYSGASSDSANYKKWHHKKDIGYSNTEAWDEVFGSEKYAKGGSTYQGGGEINVSWDKKAGKPNVVINGEEHGSISSAIEYYTLNSKKGNPNAEKNKVILIKLKKLKSGYTYQGGGEIKVKKDFGSGINFVSKGVRGSIVSKDASGIATIETSNGRTVYVHEDYLETIPTTYQGGGEIGGYKIRGYETEDYDNESDVDYVWGNKSDAINSARQHWESGNYDLIVVQMIEDEDEEEIIDPDTVFEITRSEGEYEFSKGGSTYQGGGEVEEVWNGWSVNQREHFLSDHKVLSNKADDKRVSLYRLDELPIDLLTVIKSKIKEHIERGSYKKGGSTYAEGGGIKGNYFEGELSFLNY